MTTPDVEALAGSLQADLDQRLAAADSALAQQFPGERPTRQPVHTVYVPADKYDADLPTAWGATALSVLDGHGDDELAGLMGVPAPLAEDVFARVRAKLATEPIEDLRVDFEDGYGPRPDVEEDAAVAAAVAELAAGRADGRATPYAGIRFKSFEAPTRARGVRTLTQFVAGVAASGGLGDRLLLTLPKVTSVEQVEAMVHALDRLESELGIDSGTVGFEIQIETPQSVLGPDGTALVARMIHASDGRCTGLHYGTYDYSAACGISAAHQSMEHPAADHAKAVMQVAAAGTGIRLSDGSTNVLPVGDRDRVHAGWALHARLVRRSLERGYYQGWDLHPAQLPSRYAATYAFYREAFPAAAERLRNYLGSVDAGVMDEPATARALADVVVRGLDCGALDDAEVTAATGVDRHRLDVLARRTSPTP